MLKHGLHGLCRDKKPPFLGLAGDHLTDECNETQVLKYNGLNSRVNVLGGWYVHYNNIINYLSTQTTQGSRNKRVLSAEVFIVVHS